MAAASTCTTAAWRACGQTGEEVVGAEVVVSGAELVWVEVRRCFFVLPLDGHTHAQRPMATA